MKKILLSMSIAIILLSSLSANAQYSGTFSENLSDTKYAWEVTQMPESNDSISEGDWFEYEFEEAPGGLTYEEYLNLGIIITVNGDTVDLDAETSTYTDFETLAVVMILIWAVTDPADTLTESNGYTIEGTEADDGSGFIYSTDSGVLLRMETENDQGDKFVLEYEEGGHSALPVSPFFALAGLLALPVIRRYK